MSGNRTKSGTRSTLSRRELLGASGLTLGAAALAPAAAGSVAASADGCASTLPAKWEETVDVVIVGYGGAGATAAVFAARAGARVVILEAQSRGGGSSAINDGAFTVGGGTRIQKLNGFNETPEEFYRYLKAAALPRAPDELVRAFADTARDLFDFVESLGVVFKEGYVPGYHMQPPDPEKIGLLMITGENAPEVAAVTPPVPHNHLIYGRAPAYWAKISAAVDAAGVEVLLNAQATRLIMDGSGRVIGVGVRRADGSEKCFRARKGVLLSAGGYGANQEMVAQYTPYASGTIQVTNPMDIGTGIRLGQAAGADVLGLSTCAVELLLNYRKGTEGMVKGIAVNQAGRRFVAETADGSHFGKLVYERVYPLIHVIVDQKIMDTIPAEAQSAMAVSRGATIEELARTIHVSPLCLKETLATYNQHALRGEDAEFQKDPTQLQALATPPFYAVSLSAGDVFTVTCGGLRINARAQVMSTAGKIIPGLYAAGMTAAMLCGEYYRGGTSTSLSQAFGRIAGIEMAKETSDA
ncbi:MAG: FAD-dependent oxidoreductase [Gammaproteobacteria bacterium]|nr:FAD-dependent oxidoreductase [Gammaproteobacteria bacterium]